MKYFLPFRSLILVLLFITCFDGVFALLKFDTYVFQTYPYKEKMGEFTWRLLATNQSIPAAVVRSRLRRSMSVNTVVNNYNNININNNNNNNNGVGIFRHYDHIINNNIYDNDNGNGIAAHRKGDGVVFFPGGSGKHHVVDVKEGGNNDIDESNAVVLLSPAEGHEDAGNIHECSEIVTFIISNATDASLWGLYSDKSCKTKVSQERRIVANSNKKNKKNKNKNDSIFLCFDGGKAVIPASYKDQSKVSITKEIALINTAVTAAKRAVLVDIPPIIPEYHPGDDIDFGDSDNNKDDNEESSGGLDGDSSHHGSNHDGTGIDDDADGDNDDDGRSKIGLAIAGLVVLCVGVLFGAAVLYRKMQAAQRAGMYVPTSGTDI